MQLIKLRSTKKPKDSKMKETVKKPKNKKSENQ